MLIATTIAAWYGAIIGTAVLVSRIVREVQERRRRKYWSSYAANVTQGQMQQLHGNAAQMAAMNNVIGGQNR